MNSYLEYLEEHVNSEVRPDAIKHTVNWCHANIRNIFQQEARNKGVMQLDQDDTPTIDTKISDFEEELQRERMAELGYGDTIPSTLNDRANEHGDAPSEFFTLIKQAECYASIRRACYQIAEGHGWRNWRGEPTVRTFREYLMAQWSMANQKDIKDKDIEERMVMFPEYSKEFIVSTMKNHHKRTCARIQEEIKDFISLNKGLETHLGYEEAIGKLGIIHEQNLRIKVLDGLCYDVDAFSRTAMSDTIGQNRRDSLNSNRNLYRVVGLQLRKELDEFETEHEAAINKALLTNEKDQLRHLTDEHSHMLDLFEKQCNEETNKKLKKAA